MFDSDSEEEPRHSSFVLHNAAEDGETELLRELLAPQLKGEGEGKMDADFDPEVRAFTPCWQPRPGLACDAMPDLASAPDPYL